MKTRILIFIILFIPVSSIAQVNLKSGLVAYYPFNGNANDESGNKNNPIFNNAALATDRFGNKNGAYYFNGKNSYLQIKNNSQLSPDELTLMAIIKPMGFYMGICYNNAIIDKGGPDYLRGNYALRFTAGEYTNGDCYEQSITHQNFVGMTANNGGGTSRKNYVTLNTWYCVVFTFKNGESKMYLDGRLISTESSNGVIGKNNRDIFIGKKDHEQYPYWFNGIMDEIRIYNRAITGDEVKELCKMPGTTVPPCDDSNKPAADFIYTVSNCKNILFKPKSPNQKNIKTIKWIFGDGSVSSAPSPSHSYSKYGKYTAKSIVINQAGCSDTFSREIKITELKTDFTFSESGEPGNIQFKAKNNNAAYAWAFGDGNTANSEAVTTNLYNKSGQYTVQLLAENSIGCKDTVKKRVEISLPVSIVEEPIIPNTTINSIPAYTAPEIKLEKREKDFVKNIDVENDSISISLYDNGIIDGDSITLVYNNEIILAHQLLSSKPLTLYLKVDPNRSSNELLMYADNLGSIPPNTALMIIKDGNKRHEVNVSSNKTTNGVISFTIKR